MPVDLSKLILLTSANTFKAENQIQTGSFVIGGPAPEMSATGLIVRTFNIALDVEADYYDILLNGAIITDYAAFPFPVVTDKYALAGQAGYRVLLNSTSYTNHGLVFELFPSISGKILTITAISANQFLDTGAVLTNSTITFRIIPYSATTQ